MLRSAPAAKNVPATRTVLVVKTVRVAKSVPSAQNPLLPKLAPPLPKLTSPTVVALKTKFAWPASTRLPNAPSVANVAPARIVPKVTVATRAANAVNTASIAANHVANAAKDVPSAPVSKLNPWSFLCSSPAACGRPSSASSPHSGESPVVPSSSPASALTNRNVAMATVAMVVVTDVAMATVAVAHAVEAVAVAEVATVATAADPAPTKAK